MTRTVKRTLSLALALVMICSTLGVMTFAAEWISLAQNCYSEKCGGAFRFFSFSHYEDSFNRIIECPMHGDHDAEEWYTLCWFACDTCGALDCVNSETRHVCLN